MRLEKYAYCIRTASSHTAAYKTIHEFRLLATKMSPLFGRNLGKTSYSFSCKWQITTFPSCKVVGNTNTSFCSKILPLPLHIEITETASLIAYQNTSNLIMYYTPQGKYGIARFPLLLNIPLKLAPYR